MIAAVLGWTGTIGTFVAYLLVARGRVTAQSRKYAALNGVGGLMAAVASASYGAWPSAASNAVWAVIGFWTLAVVTRARRRPALALVPLDPPPTPTPTAAPESAVAA